jgi:uncharacterized membrane protein
VIALTTIARGDASRIVDSRRVVVRTPEEWRVLWALHAGPDAAAPAIDFDSVIIAAAFAGEKPTAGHGIEIIGAIGDLDGVRVIVDDHAPGPAMVTAQILTSPFHIVSFPRTEREVRWSEGDFAAEDRGPRAEARTKPGSRTAHLGPRTADFGAQTSDVEPRTADLGPRTSGLRSRTADLGSRTSDLDTTTSSGLSPTAASVLAYLAGPFSGALMLFVGPSNPDVRFHAWQSIIALGGLGLAVMASYLLAFAALFVSATGVSLLVRVSTAMWLALLIVWAICLWKAVSGERWKLPLAGEYAERIATSTRPTPARQAPPTR